MIAMAMPILVLYFGAIGVCALIERLRSRRAARRDADPAVEVPPAPEVA